MTDYGYKPLVAWITEHMRRIHAPPRPVELLLTCGNTNGIDLCLRTLMQRGDAVLSEEFTYASTLQVRLTAHFAPTLRTLSPRLALSSRRCGHWA